MDCGDCHTMHGSEPDMQLRSDFDIEAACEGCHRRTELGVQHGGHTRVDCQGCHMPRITYGLLEGMMSHRVTVPDPGRWVGRDDMPDACTQCHVDRDRMWAAEAMGQLGLSGSAPAKPAPSEAWGSRVGVDLVGGDPVQRTLAAHALARPEATGSVRTRMAWLVDGLEDEYPAVRWFAWRGIVELATTTGHAPVLATIGGFDPLADPLPRLEVVARLREILGSSPIAARPQRWESLLLARDGRAIEIGE
jgi:predicted CXXCH cytochrome family protein